jgi:hypothetical protein
MPACPAFLSRWVLAGDLEQKSSFMDGHYLKQESCMKINESLYNFLTRTRFSCYFLGTIIKKGNTHDVSPLK